MNRERHDTCTVHIGALNINRNKKRCLMCEESWGIWLPWLMGLLCVSLLLFGGREGKFMIALSFVFFIFLESDYAACQLNDNRNCDGWKALKSSSSAINLSQKILTIRRVLGLTFDRASFNSPQISGVIRFTATIRVTLTKRIVYNRSVCFKMLNW